MVEGSTGTLYAKQNYVQSTLLSNGYTRFTVPSGKKAITLISTQCECMRITHVSLNAPSICPNGSPLTVKVVFFTCSGSKVSWYNLYTSYNVASSFQHLRSNDNTANIAQTNILLYFVFRLRINTSLTRPVQRISTLMVWILIFRTWILCKICRTYFSRR